MYYLVPEGRHQVFILDEEITFKLTLPRFEKVDLSSQKPNEVHYQSLNQQHDLARSQLVKLHCNGQSSGRVNPPPPTSLTTIIASMRT